MELIQSASLSTILLIGGLILLCLMLEPLRKLLALALALAMAFGAGWYWPKSGHSVTTLQSPPCVSSF